MSFDKYMGKERRKPYKGGKAISKSCRNHGGCPACESNRQHKNRKRLLSYEEELKNFLTNEDYML